MGRSISNPTTGVIVNINIPIAKGGTGATTAAGALTNLGLVANSDSSIVRLGADLKVAATDVPAMPVKALVSGPSSVVGGNTTGYTYTITNLDSATTYTIGAFGGGTVKWTGGTLSANNGTVSGNAATFVYYPNPSTDASAGLWVDGRQIAMASVTQSTIGKPIINSGVNLTGQVEKPTLAGSAYSAVQSLSGTTLLRSEWEFYTASNYTGTPITQSSNATSMTLTTALAHGTSYYVRVRYVCSYTLGGAASATEQYSAWSNDAASPFTLATMAEFTMGSPAGTVYGGVASSITINSYDATATYTVSGTNMTATPTRTGSTISFTPTVSATTASITLNDGHGAVTQNITVTPSVVNGPASWTAPATDGITGQGSSVTLTFTDPSPLGIGLYASDTHTSTDWQITSSDPATDNWTTFTAADGAVSLVASTTNKNSYTVTGLVVSKTYWYRARIKSSSGAVGAWSVGRSFTTKSSFGLSATSIATITNPNTAGLNDNFGCSVSIATNGTNYAVIIGDSEISYGKVYIYTNSGGTNGSWSLSATINNNVSTYGNFGTSVAIASNGSTYTAIVGAGGNNSGIGRVYIYSNSSGSWNLINYWDNPISGATASYFGNSVAIASNGTTYMAIVGAYAYNSNAGSSFIYTNSGGNWSATPVATYNGTVNNQFGYSVAIASNGSTYTAIVGAPSYNSNTGKAYIYTYSSGYWTNTEVATYTGEATGDSFGLSVAIASNGVSYTAIVGAQNYNSYRGRAYIYSNSGGSWSPTPAATMTGGAINDFFAATVSIGYNGSVYTALIGLPYYNSNTGMAYLYSNGNNWSSAIATISAIEIGKRFGGSASIANNLSIIGTIPGNSLNVTYLGIYS